MRINHLPEEFKIKEGAEEFPLMVVLSFVYICNARCPQCPYTQTNIRADYKDALYMPEELFKKIADECGQYQAYIRLSGGGEPLLHPKALDLVEYAKEKRAKIGLITNGSLIDGKKAGRLLACGTDMIEFSVDAADKETYSQLRKGLSFGKLVENVRYIVQKRDQLNSPSRIIASIINQKAVEGKLDSVVSFWGEIVDDVQVRKYLTWGYLNDHSADSRPYLPPEQRIPCPWLFERLNIDSRGDVTLCGEDIAFKEKFANVYKQPIKEIWRGPVFEKARRLHLRCQGDQIPLCRNCPDWQYRSWTHNYWKLEAERKADINKK